MNTSSGSISISLLLSHVLGNIGVSDFTVRKRRQLYHEIEVVKEIGYTLMHKACQNAICTKVFCFGSAIEGSTTLGLKSDVDLVYVRPYWYTFESFRSPRFQSVSRNDVLLNLEIIDSTYPGHCRLSVVNTSILYQGLDINHQNTYLLSHTDIETFQPCIRDTTGIIPIIKNGPSSFCLNTDYVQAILVPLQLSWKNECFHRFNCYNWPTETTMHNLLKTTKLLVPVCHPLSDDGKFDWRTSYSFAEKLLIYSFNITQLRCLVILKMIKKTFFEPIVQGEFTSYHCKTILFYTIAKTSPSLWKEDRLSDCIFCCLSTLKHFLFNKYCPHFFDQSVNLFVGKITPLSCKSLVILVERLIIKPIDCLLEVCIDDLGARIINVPTALAHRFFPARSVIENRIVFAIEAEKHQFLVEFSRHPYVLMNECKHTVKKQIYTGFILIKDLLSLMNDGNKTEYYVAKLFLPHFVAKHASLLSSYRIKKKQPISEDLINLFKISFLTDATSNRLKLASVFCCNGDHIKARLILEELADKYSAMSMTINTCFQYIEAYLISWDIFFETESDAFPFTGCKIPPRLFSDCVEVMIKDIWCCPKGLRTAVLYNYKEHVKNFQDVYRFSSYFGLEVDSKAMLHYLQFVTYAGMSLDEFKGNALKDLLETVIDNPWKWKTHFFKAGNSTEEEIVCRYRDLYFHGDVQYRDLVTPKLINNLRKNCWGSVQFCISYAFGKTSTLQHINLALMLIGYCFEQENNIDFAVAFYWMSFIIEGCKAAAKHIERVRPHARIVSYFHDYFNFSGSMKYSIQLEISLIPELVESFANIMKACISVGNLKEEEFLECTYRARCHVILLNALVKNYDRQTQKSLDIYSGYRSIMQDKKSSLLM